MAKKRQTKANGSEALVEGNGGREKGDPRSLPIAAKGVKTGADFANLMSALMSDLIEGRVTPQMGNATCNAGGKLLKIVEMQYKYGTQSGGNGKKILTLALEEPLETVSVG